ncbi:MAG: hypothetical protein J7496_13710 [Novosphingobium sp.]|nr:hypothetical protein [Novosphingobium sp.]MBO9603553.1 hypothetical protein [Novosphingobium sp.]
MPIETRGLRVAAALPMVLLLCAARTSVTPLPQTVAPDSAAPKLRTMRTVHAGDVVMRGLVYDTEVVTLEAPLSLSIAKFSQDIEAGTKLDPVLVPKKTTKLTGTDGRIYCGEDQRTRSKFMDAMLGDWFSKYESVVRFCFVDTDGDRKLDHAFLAGAKDKADQGAIEIPPTPYASRMLQPDPEGAALELRVSKLLERPEGDKLELKLFLSESGKEVPFDYLMTVEGGKARETRPRFVTDPKKVPYPAYFNDVMGGEVEVSRVDAKAGEADVAVLRPFRLQLFKPVSIRYTYVFIYY